MKKLAIAIIAALLAVGAVEAVSAAAEQQPQAILGKA